MLKRTRVSSAPDMDRIAAAVSRPGIDPRIWISAAVVTAVTVDPNEGVFVDVTLLPSLVETTARLASEYAGGGFGLYFPVRIDDEVLVEAPSGDPADGLVISKRMWSPSDPPPSEVVSNPADVVLVLGSGVNLRIVTNGGTVQFDGDSDALALASKVEQALNTHVHSGVTTGGGTSGPVSQPVSGTGSSVVKAGE